MTTSNAQTILGFLRSKGLSDAQAAGVLGNWQVESGFNPTSTNTAEGAIGVAQWENGRRTALQQYAQRTGGSATDLTTQLGYFWTELTSRYTGAYRDLKAAQDPTTAAHVIQSEYEISSPDSLGTREADARSIYQQITTGHLLSAGAPATSSTGGTTNAEAASLSGAVKSVIGFGNDLLPWNWAKDLGGAWSSVLGVVIEWGTKVMFIGGGLGLVVIGLYVAAQPVRDKVNDTVQQAAPLAAAIA